MTTYLVYGFNRQDHEQRVCMLVDRDPRDASSPPSAAAERIAGPEFRFHWGMNVSVAVPDELKNRLLPEAELYARIPELDLSRRRKRRRHSA